MTNENDFETKKYNPNKKITRVAGIPIDQFILVVCFLAPAFIYLAIFWIGNQIVAIGQGFTDINTGEFTLDNYKYLFEALKNNSDNLGLCFRNTFIYFGISMARIPISIFIAYMFYKKMPGHIFVRVVLFIPPTVCGLMFVYSYKFLISDMSPIIQWLREIGLQFPQDLLAAEGTTMIIIFDVWLGIVGNMIIWFGAMSRIPEELVEYAIFDGISPIQEFWYITLPLIFPTFVTITTLGLMGIFGASGSVLPLTEGRYGTSTFAYWQYEALYKNESFGFQHKVVATGHLITIATLPVVFGGRWLMNKFGDEVEY